MQGRSDPRENDANDGMTSRIPRTFRWVKLTPKIWAEGGSAFNRRCHRLINYEMAGYLLLVQARMKPVEPTGGRVIDRARGGQSVRALRG